MSRTKKKPTAAIHAVPPDIAAFQATERKQGQQLMAMFGADPRQLVQDLDELFARVEVLSMAACAHRDGYDSEISSDGSTSLADALNDLWRFMWNGSTLNEPLRSTLGSGACGLREADDTDGAQ